ncbi:MAG: DUF4355 domain-containing protein [Alphaproteobacteria bacterium]|nr:DUF4355 domain-containing protein [Alphaproteobacteria bacterium]
MEISEEDLKKRLDEAAAKAREGMLTQEDVDKAISKRVAEIKKKHNEELEDERNKAKMSAEELQKHELEKIKAEKAELEKTLKAKEHSEKIVKLMSEKEIDTEFLDLFSGISDIDVASATMDKFCEKLKSKVNAAVDSKIKSHVPDTNTGNSSNPNPNAAINNQIRAALGRYVDGE